MSVCYDTNTRVLKVALTIDPQVRRRLSAVVAETPVTITASDGTLTLSAILAVICPTGPTAPPSFQSGETVFIHSCPN